MNILVVGPTGAGKSTLIHAPELAGLLVGGPVPANVLYGYELLERSIRSEERRGVKQCI